MGDHEGVRRKAVTGQGAAGIESKPSEPQQKNTNRCKGNIMPHNGFGTAIDIFPESRSLSENSSLDTYGIIQEKP
jgi:hypothetical protein